MLDEGSSKLDGTTFRSTDSTYRLDELLKRGGFAEVYRGIHVKLGTSVAVKIPLPERLKSGNRGSLEAEAKYPARIKVGVVKCIDYVPSVPEAGHRPALVMEYIDGKTLDHHIRSGFRLPALVALRIARQIAATLVAAASRHIVHCDLSPKNIMLADFDPIAQTTLVKVIDWGLARHAEDHAQGVLGIVPSGYCPPEPADKAGQAYDLFSFGTILVQMLTGRFPKPRLCDENNKGELVAFLAHQLVGHSEQLRGLIMRCLQREPARRGMADQVQDELGEILAEEEARENNGLRSVLVVANSKLETQEAEMRLLREERERAIQERDGYLKEVGSNEQKLDQNTHELHAALDRIKEQAKNLDEKRRLLNECQQRLETTAKQSREFQADLEQTQRRLAEVIAQEAVILNQLAQRERERNLARNERDAALGESDKLRNHYQQVGRSYLQLRKTVGLELISLPDFDLDGSSPGIDLTPPLSQATKETPELAALRSQLESHETRIRAWRLATLGTSLAGIVCVVGIGVMGHCGGPPPSPSDLATPQDATVRRDLAVPVPDLARTRDLGERPPVRWYSLDSGLSSPTSARWLDVYRDGKTSSIYLAGDYCDGCPGDIDEPLRQERARAVLLVSEDEGVHFRQIPIRQEPKLIIHSLYGLWGAEDGTVFAVGEGAVLRLKKSGRDVLQIPYRSTLTNKREPLRGVWGHSAADVYISSADPSGNLVHYGESAAGAPRLEDIALRAHNSLRRLQGVGGDVWVVGDGGTIIRYDTRRKRPLSYDNRSTPALPGEVLYDVATNGEELLFCGAIKNSAQGVLYRFQPESGQWERRTLQSPCYRLMSVGERRFIMAGMARAGRALTVSNDAFATVEQPFPLPGFGRALLNLKSVAGTGPDYLVVAGDGVLFMRR